MTVPLSSAGLQYTADVEITSSSAVSEPVEWCRKSMRLPLKTPLFWGWRRLTTALWKECHPLRELGGRGKDALPFWLVVLVFIAVAMT